MQVFLPATRSTIEFDVLLMVFGLPAIPYHRSTLSGSTDVSVCKRLPASNTFKDLRTEGWVVTRAKTDIRAGEELTFLYAAKMEGRWEKRTAFERIFGNIALAGCLDAPFFGEAGTLTVAVQGNRYKVVAV